MLASINANSLIATLRRRTGISLSTETPLKAWSSIRRATCTVLQGLAINLELSSNSPFQDISLKHARVDFRDVRNVIEREAAPWETTKSHCAIRAWKVLRPAGRRRRIGVCSRF